MIERVVVLSTGDELTTGKVIDTNSSAIADSLFTAGIEVAAVLTVGDRKEKLHWALRQGRALADLIIGTGTRTNRGRFDNRGRSRVSRLSTDRKRRSRTIPATALRGPRYRLDTE